MNFTENKTQVFDGFPRKLKLLRGSRPVRDVVQEFCKCFPSESLSASSLYGFENGHPSSDSTKNRTSAEACGSMRLSTFPSLCEFYNVSPEYFFQESDNAKGQLSYHKTLTKLKKLTPAQQAALEKLLDTFIDE